MANKFSTTFRYRSTSESVLSSERTDCFDGCRISLNLSWFFVVVVVNLLPPGTTGVGPNGVDFRFGSEVL